MSTGRNREDGVLDEIDRLVDASLSRGDQSDSFHGARFRDEHPCPWCGEGFHFLPITKRMQEMRFGSYATDEFGCGIVDPDYDYRRDESSILCPGSEYHGPRDKYGTWDKQSRERAEEKAARSRQLSGQEAIPGPRLPAGRLRKLRFVGPFDDWVVELRDERIIEELISDPASVGLPGPRQRIPTVIETRLLLILSYEAEFMNRDLEWVTLNAPDIESSTVTTRGGFRFRMKPISIPFQSYIVYYEPGHSPPDNPDWVEFTTTYPIERHPWLMPFFQVIDDHRCCVECDPDGTRTGCAGHCACGGIRHRQGHESDIVIIDEHHEFSDQEMRERVDHDVQARVQARSTSAPPPEASSEDER